MPPPLSTLTFTVEPWPDGGLEVDPVVDGVLLGEAMELDLAGVLVGSRGDVSRLRADLLGGGSTWGRAGYAMLQVCGCGVPEDDLLATHVSVGDVVEWSDLQQQSRPPPTHRDVGPFRFDRRAYEEAVDAMADEAARLLRGSRRRED